MSEVEVKLSISDIDKAREMLKARGFKLLEVCREEDAYYTHPCRDFSSSDEALRFRVRACNSGSRAYIVSYKGPRQPSNQLGLKVREERELTLSESDWWKLKEIFEKLGFKPATRFWKSREVYAGGVLEAYIDTLFGVGHFIEIEVKSHEGVELLARLVADLKSSLSASVISKTYLEICLETNKCVSDLQLL